MRNESRKVNGTIRSWLIMDNADDNIDIEMMRLNMISKELSMIDETLHIDNIAMLFKTKVM